MTTGVFILFLLCNFFWLIIIIIIILCMCFYIYLYICIFLDYVCMYVVLTYSCVWIFLDLLIMMYALLGIFMCVLFVYFLCISMYFFARLCEAWSCSERHWSLSSHKRLTLVWQPALGSGGSQLQPSSRILAHWKNKLLFCHVCDDWVKDVVWHLTSWRKMFVIGVFLCVGKNSSPCCRSRWSL